MRVALITIGSRGDTQPFVALAVGLMRAGHAVCLAAPSNFAEMAEDYGIPFTAVEWDAQAFLQDARVKNVVQSGRTGALFRREGRAAVHGIYQAAARAAWDISAGADALVYKVVVSAGSSAAEARGIAGIEASIVPWQPSGELPVGAILGPFLNRQGGRLVRLFLWQLLCGSANHFRRAHGLKPFSRWGVPPRPPTAADAAVGRDQPDGAAAPG